ncbi:hypothetical protein KVR01_013570 [Diaporthe batatas]|uniref:uncharacterized protein n=1 Tax=Diaporthe batatas TaxID=748121 RepID=UPI001D044716|nr:uncharacterized protein KVR01_013570 [Diaporthe batatas]KAG8156619.1 hypothetical protein KVR01_013570 [Diaporthe batatas]
MQDPPKRRSTDQSIKSLRSQRRRNTAPPQSGTEERCQDIYSSYRLNWATLRGYLQRKWPDFNFPEDGLQENDHWIFYVPQKLDEVDRHEIAILRDDELAKSSAPPRSPSPE